jgi:hypothetical protein
MKSLLEREVDAILAGTAPLVALDCERPLRIAAATVAGGRASEVVGTRVVGVLGHDHPAEVEDLVARLAAEFGLEAKIGLHGGSFAVRFSRPN